ncbi:MAG: hypothetical protein K2K42_05680 [Eubacterium sp.]|nr:hypothetical protein [Eubacterium sp.]
MKVFTKEQELFGNSNDKKVQDYLNYEKKFLPKWYNEFSIHDNIIIQVIKTKDLLILDSVYDDSISTKYQLKFYNPTIIEDCEMENAWCLVDELYINENECEYHLLVEDSTGNKNYFTVKCSDIELCINGRTYRVFGKSDKSSIFENDFENNEKAFIKRQIKNIEALIQNGDPKIQDELKNLRKQLEDYAN